MQSGVIIGSFAILKISNDVQTGREGIAGNRDNDGTCQTTEKEKNDQPIFKTTPKICRYRDKIILDNLIMNIFSVCYEIILND